MTPHHFTLRTDRGVLIWNVARLRQLAKALPVRTVAVESISALDVVCWFGEERRVAPTCKAVATHARRIYEADLNYPIILSAEGHVMDGLHRAAKAWILGLNTVQAVQFPITPEPDEARDPIGGVSTLSTGSSD